MGSDVIYLYNDTVELWQHVFNIYKETLRDE